jgi:Skp family chaperone for outer membrane proteins
MKKEMEEEIEKRDEKMQRMERDFTARYQELYEKFEKAHYDSLLF